MELNVPSRDNADQLGLQLTGFCMRICQPQKTGPTKKSIQARVLSDRNLHNSPSQINAADERKFKRVNGLDIIETKRDMSREQTYQSLETRRIPICLSILWPRRQWSWAKERRAQK